MKQQHVSNNLIICSQVTLCLARDTQVDVCFKCCKMCHMAHYSSVTQIPVEQIRPHKSIKARQADIPIQYLADCKAAGAIIEPSICTVGSDDNRYTLMSHPWGWHAAQLLMYPTIPVIALAGDHSSYKPFLAMDTDNDLVSWSEELYGVLKHQGMSVTKLANKLGMNRSTLSHTLQFRKLNVRCVDALRRQLINKGHAKRLAYLDPQKQLAALEWLLTQESIPTVDEFQIHLKSSAVKAVSAEAVVDVQTVSTARKDPDILKYEQRISEHFGCKAELIDGKLSLDYCSNLDVLEGILEKSNFQ